MWNASAPMTTGDDPIAGAAGTSGGEVLGGGQVPLEIQNKAGGAQAHVQPFLFRLELLFGHDACRPGGLDPLEVRLHAPHRLLHADYNLLSDALQRGFGVSGLELTLIVLTQCRPIAQGIAQDEARPVIVVVPAEVALEHVPKVCAEARQTRGPLEGEVGEKPEQVFPPAAVYGTLGVSLLLGLGIFFALPVLAASFLTNFGVTPLWSNIVEGVIRLGLFLAYLIFIGRIPEIQRVFQYHGAEHKTVFTWEAGLPLTVDNARPQPRQHPRCGTSFLMVVMLVAIVLFSVIKFDSLLFNFLIRLALMPVVAGVSYEIIRMSAKKESSWFFKLMTKPGVWLQNITTQEPDDNQLEVAIEALKESLKLEPQTGEPLPAPLS